MPRVTVVMPAHNAGHVIGEALGSLAAQTYADWEVIVADDASTDDTATRASEALGGRITVVRSEHNLGPAGARNLALREGAGELVAFLDADDLWLPEYLERQVGRFDAEARRSGPPVGIVACDASVRSQGATLAGTYLDQFHQDVEPLTLARVLQRNCIYISALVPRAAGERAGWFDESLFGTEDHDLWIRILEDGYRAVLNREVLAVYNRSSGSVSSDLARMATNNQGTYQRALARGRLPSREVRIARSELRYNRAMEAVARAWFRRDRATLARNVPVLLWILFTRPRHWADWVRALRGSR